VTTPSTGITALGIINDAMKDVGKLRAGSDPDSEIIVEYTRRLNKLVNFYMTQGLKLWLIQDQLITLLPPISSTTGVALYTLGPTGTVSIPKPLRVISAYYLDIYGTQRPLIPLSYPDEYKRLSTLLQPGSINSYAVDKQQLTLNVYLWNPPTAFDAANGSVHLMIEAPVTNFLGITDQMNFPIEWALLLEWGLAEQISTGQPISVQARAAAMAEKYRLALEDWDVEDADTMFQPDQREAQFRGRFR
jgi:hypothetical protein